MSAQPVESTGALKPGDVVGGKYQIEEVLGVGGMGTVHAARHLILKQRVALKVLLPEAAALPEATERFLREAQAAAAIQGEHVARVLDVGMLPDGAPYLVMELLAGQDFGKVLKTRGPMPIAEAVDLVLQAGEAIAEAHALGIIHRDLKPGNLFLSARPDGSPLVKVLDFGLSKSSAPGGVGESSLTATSLVVGSSYYMAPEQFRGLRHADARSDLWALGVILFHLISGRRPFEGDSFGAVCAAVAADPALPLREALPEAPPELEALLLRCMEKDRSRRVQTMAELAEALAPFGTPAAAISVARIARLSSGGRATLTSDPGSGPASSGARASALRTPLPEGRASTPGAPPRSSSTPLPGTPPRSGSTPLPGAAAVATPLPPSSASPPVWEATRVSAPLLSPPPVHPRRRGALWITGGAAILLAVIVGVSFTRLGSGDAGTPVAGAEAALQPAGTPGEGASPAAVVTGEPAASGTPSAAPAASSDAPVAAETAPSTRKKSPRTKPSASPRPKPRGDALDRWN